MDISLVKEELAKLSRKSSLQSPSEVRTQAWLLLSVAGLLVLKHCHLLSDMWSCSSCCSCSVHPHTRYNQCCSPSSRVVIPARSTAKLKWTRFSRWTISNYSLVGLDMNQLHNAPSKRWNHRAIKKPMSLISPVQKKGVCGLFYFGFCKNVLLRDPFCVHEGMHSFSSHSVCTGVFLSAIF